LARIWGWWRPSSIRPSSFDPPFEHPVADLTEPDGASLLNLAAVRLRALGRLGEAMAPLQAVLARDVEVEAWQEAANSASNLSQLQLALGDVATAEASGEAAIEYADLSDDGFVREVNRTTLADARHRAGAPEAAAALFEEAEAMQADRQPGYHRLYSFRGYQYCDLLLTLGKAEAVRERALQTLEWAKPQNWLLDIALDHLSLGRAALALEDRDEAGIRLDQAVDGLVEAGHIEFIPRGLLARAALFRETGKVTRSWRDLDEAMRIAERGGMRLFQCDAHLGYAHLALAEGKPDTAREHLESARALVSACGYHRRDGEVEELEKALA